MKEKEILRFYKERENLIDNCRIQAAIDSLRSALSENKLMDSIRQLDTIEETYRYMIHYLLQGAQDAGRDSLLTDIKERLHFLNDISLRETLSNDNDSYYYEIYRMNKFRNETVENILKLYEKTVSELSLAEASGNDTSEIRKQREDILERLFNNLLTSLGADNELKDLKNYLLSNYSDMSVFSLSLSAITLSLLEFYDRSKLNMLLDIYENSDNEAILAKSLVGIFLTLMFYPSRIENDSKIKSRLYLWNDSLDTYQRLRETIRVIVGTRDTQRVTEKMKEEVLPEIMKLRPEILKNLRESNLENGNGLIENNPEWEEILEKTGLNDKMRELSEMQGEGADLLMVTFSNLKQFPFFNSASNWFLPFDINHTSLKLNNELKKFVTFLTGLNTNVCDSDLYSLALASSSMPDMQRRMITNEMATQFEQLNEEIKDKELLTNTSGFNREVLKSVRDLYRFFKLFRKRKGFKDPFEKTLNFMEMPVIGEMMHNDDMLRLIGEFYFKRGFYLDALPLLNALTDTFTDDSFIWEKIGYSYQSIGEFQKAKEAYEKASLIKQPGPWLTKKLAYINRRLGNYQEAAEYYRKAIEMDSENISLIMNLGNTLLETEDIAGSLKHFYHANYLSPDNPKVLRAIAWLEMLNGNLSKSAGYYEKIIKTDAKNSDYLNAGHSQLLLGNYREALNFYRLASRDDKKQFEQAFFADINTLEKLGADRNTVLLIFDVI